MLISRVPEERERENERNYRTASELFDLMARDHDFDTTGEDPLTTSDLVLLYKNIDLGKQLMSTANEMKRPNQRVESVVYDEPESESDLSECCSSDHLALVNQERLDLFAQSHPALAHKRPDLGLRTATADYDRQFLFKDPYIKEQLKNLTLMSTTDDSPVLPASLLDYICCKRLEDNYNFYMDNIIRYVKNTIEQLKRISNGDYLTDRAKQKWREVENEKEDDGESKVLTASTSIPLHVERKRTGVTTMWDELVHSEVDLRSLAKILEKRIVLEVPKLISGSYKLFSNRVADNLVISCARAPPAAARVDVTLQLRRARAGHVVSNIDSIMILESDQSTTQTDATTLLPLTYDVAEEKKEEETPKIIELDEPEPHSNRDTLLSDTDECPSRDNEGYTPSLEIEEYSSICECSKSETENMASLSESFAAPVRRSRLVRGDVVVNLATPEDVRLTLRALPPLDSMPDETTDDSFYKNKKKTSPTRVRIKSPYENKSHILEERKRRKLLEVRERRERKKLAMNENKMKNKFCKSAVVPQASSSVTKLSITNKSFYNSIFGQHLNVENKQMINGKGRKGKKEDMIPEMVPEQSEGERDEVASVESDQGKKYVNRSYYLDDAMTEMMFLQMKGDGVRASASTSAVSNDSVANQGSLSQLSNSSLANLELREPLVNEKLSPRKYRPKELVSQSSLQIVPSNSPKESPGEPAVECRRSIDKIYVLMKKLGKIEPRRHGLSAGDGADASRSDSGTSLKHRLASSNPSSFSFEKPNEGFPKDELSNRPERAVIPKVIISTKQRPKLEEKKIHRRSTSPRKPFPDNPLKAISQLLHEFDHVQKTRQKTADSRSVKSPAAPTDVKVLRQEVQSGRRRGRESKASSPRKREAQAAAGAGVGAGAEAAAEARGEAVRGPPADARPAPTLSSRLNALAQPKRPYALPRPDDPRYSRAQIPERAARVPPGRPRSRRADAPPPGKPAPVPIAAERARGRRADGSPERRAPPAAPPPTALKKKMNAVESYVKQHYGRGASALSARAGAGPGPGGAGPGPGAAGGAGGAHTARAPLLPSDFEISSFTSSPMPDESSELGSKLHHIIDSMLRAPPAPAPRSPPKKEKPQAKPSQDSQPRASLTELALLEDALGRKVSAGAFSKRLRLKNLTLTPKHSARIVLLQSGDAASLFLGSQTLKSDTLETSADCKTLTLSATRLDWRFSRMPMQISTVGYAFPTYDRNPIAKPKLIDIDTIVSKKELTESDMDSLSEDVDTKDQTCQCFKGIASSQGLECAVQAGAADFDTPATPSDPDPFEGEFLSHISTTSPDTTPVDPSLQHLETEKIVDEQLITKLDVCQVESPKGEIENSGNVVEEKSEILDYTTSLDMLVGLLNEIQKITSNPCESPRSPSPSDGRTSSGVVPVESDDTGACVDKMDASTSKTEELSVEVERVSKEVSAQFPTPGASVSVSTDVPSRCKLDVPSRCKLDVPSRCELDATTHDAGDMTLVPVKMSSSCVSFSEYKTCSELSINVRRISDLPIAPGPGYVKSLVVFHDAYAAKIKDADVSLMCKRMVKKAPVRREKTNENVVARVDVVRNRGQKKNVAKCCLNAADFDPMMKMKRDILVTVYSVLVLTVFAALSLPDMLHA